MHYREITPGQSLRSYVKNYFIYESSSNLDFQDTVFPSGCMEIIFNLGSGKWQTHNGREFVTTPAVEFWGQVIQPLRIKSIGLNTMLGIRFFPHGTAFFLNENLEVFNNQVTDFSDLFGIQVKRLHEKLMEVQGWKDRIKLLEEFLLEQLVTTPKSHRKISVVNDVMNELTRKDFFDNIENVASRYGISSRYLQKLFLQYTGLTPKLYSKIDRFQNSLRLICRKENSLTSIAYDCGYSDQSHFIRDFKSFTGITPSDYSPENSPVSFAFAAS